MLARTKTLHALGKTIVTVPHEHEKHANFFVYCESFLLATVISVFVFFSFFLSFPAECRYDLNCTELNQCYKFLFRLMVPTVKCIHVNNGVKTAFSICLPPLQSHLYFYPSLTYSELYLELEASILDTKPNLFTFI